MGLSIDCARFHSIQHAHSEVILKENKTDDVICLHFGVHVCICGHMIPSSDIVQRDIFTSFTHLKAFEIGKSH